VIPFGRSASTPISAAYAGRGVESLAASQCVYVLHALRQRHLKPAFAAILSAEHLAIARRDVDLLGVAGAR
jgi:hypothetical protein